MTPQERSTSASTSTNGTAQLGLAVELREPVVATSCPPRPRVRHLRREPPTRQGEAGITYDDLREVPTSSTSPSPAMARPSPIATPWPSAAPSKSPAASSPSTAT
jgi:hypothetical protein